MGSMTDDINAQAAGDPKIIALRRYVHGLLEPRLKLIFDAMTDHLFNLSASAQLTAEGRSQAFEGFSTLKVQHKALVASTLTEINQAYGKLVEINGEDPSNIPAELDLVDLEEFENNLAIDRIVRAGSERYWVQLEALTLRIAELIDQDPKSIRLPFGLRGLVTAYRKAIKPLELSGAIVSELDRGFARNVLPELGQIYKTINGRLENDGLMPGIESELETSGSRLEDKKAPDVNSHSTPREPANQSPLQTPLQTPLAQSTPGFEQVPQQSSALKNTALPQGSDAGNGYGQSPLSQPGVPGQSGASPTLMGGAQQGGLASSAAALSPATPYLSDMGQQQSMPLADAALQSARGHSFLDSAAPLVAPSPLDEVASSGGHSDFLPGRGSQALNTTVDGGVLDRLRSGFGTQAADFEPLPPAELAARATELVNTVAALRMQGVRASEGQSLLEQLGLNELGPEAEPLRGSVQLVDNLYQTMIDTLPMSEGLSKSMHALKLPLAQVSLLDPDFYRNREHPARLLVERLSEVSSLAPKNNARVEKRLDEVLNSVADEYDGELEVFDRALTEVTDIALTMLKQQQRNIQRSVAAEEGKEKRQIATQAVDGDLVGALSDTVLPTTLQRVAQDIVRDELTLTRLREGENETYRGLLEQVASVNNALQEITSGGQPLDTEATQTQMQALRGLLQNGEYLTPAQETLLDTLARELTGEVQVDLADSALGNYEVFAEPAFTERLQNLPRLHRWVKRARDLDLSTWLAETLPNGDVRNLQLIWRNGSGTRFAFANEQGQKVRDLDLVELARWLGSRLRPLAPSEQLSIIEKSVFQTLERKQQDLASVARASEDEDSTRAELTDRVQSLLRRARRKGASHCAVAIHTDRAAGTQQILNILENQGIAIEATGQLSPSTRCVLAEVDSVEALQRALAQNMDNSESAGIGISLIDASKGSAEDLLRAVEETAKRGLSLSPNTGVVTETENRPTDLAGAVQRTYVRLRDDMPPRLSLRRLTRSAANNPTLTESVFQVLLDGSPDAGGELRQQSGYHSAALSIALDCAKINATCRFAEHLVTGGREIPVFHIRVSTDAAIHHEFLDFVLSEVSESGIGTDRLCIELRDSARLREESRAADFARTLRSIGCQISVCEVNPQRGSTGELQTLNPNMLALDPSMWPPTGEASHLPALHQTISDLHHLVGEHVVIRDNTDTERAHEFGIDFIESIDPREIEPETLFAALPQVQR